MPAPELKPLVFLSHSVGGDQAASDLLDKLSKGLEKLGWDPYVDRERLQPGTLWRHQLHTALGACDAAVILFSKKAYDDLQWVLKEATIFRWRHSLDPDFTVVPVLFPEVSRLDLSANHYKPLMLGELVPVQLPQANVVKAVAKALGPKRVGLSPIELLQQSISKKFEGVSTNVLKQAAAKLGKPLDWRKRLAPHEQFAIHLFHAEMPQVRAALSAVAPEMKSADDVRYVINLLEPFTVEPLAVEPIPRIARHDAAAAGARPVIALNSRHEDTGKRYVQRARCSAEPWSIVTLANAGGADDEGSLAAELLKAFRDQYFPDSDDDEIRGMLDVSQQEGTPFFVLVHGPIASTTINALRNEFPSCVFFVLAGETTDDAGMEQSGIRILVPKLDSAQEKNARAQINLTRVIAVNKEKQSK